MSARRKPADEPRSSPAPLVPLRLSEQDASDLRWLLHRDFIGDCGVKSNMGDIVDRLERMCPKHGPEKPSDSWHVITVQETFSRTTYELSDRLFEAASRLRDSLRRWHAVSDEHRATLALVYVETREVLPGWGEIGPLVLRSRVAARAHAKSRSTKGLGPWLARLRGQPAATETYAAIRADAEGRLLPACRAWEQSRYRRARHAA